MNFYCAKYVVETHLKHMATRIVLKEKKNSERKKNKAMKKNQRDETNWIYIDEKKR